MTMSEEIIKVLDSLCAKVGMTIDWTVENVSPYLGELFEGAVKYELSTSVFHIVFWCVITIVLLVIMFCAWPYAKRVNFEDGHLVSDIVELSSFLAFMSVLIWFAVIACQVPDIIACCTMPERIILDYLKSLV